jgi:starch phosphorylase
VKRARKQALSNHMRKEFGVAADPDSMFDVQAKRIHEYKRQHLNVLHIVTLYNRLKRAPRSEITPRTFIFGGKAAPGYAMAKLIIKLITAVGDVVNDDADVAGRLKVVFVPNFSVKNGHRLYPAADLSEQISTAGKEASGTGNMKFSMNGALTIGTMDGANVEIREEVGAENFFLFGLDVDGVQRTKQGGYRPSQIYQGNRELKEAIDLIDEGMFSHGDRSLFKPLVEHFKTSDEYLVLADYADYLRCQDEVGAAFRDADRWTRMSILNVARIGKFSSDRTVRDYDRDIWKVGPLPIKL